ncbi:MULTISPECIES: type III effector [unclassified Pseudomonas]|uniref:type III effector n=1 Tax=unclassified Pseudomonas TaxID=196821 RepID=UPI000F55EF43|nr:MULTISPECIES: type III effector [unclassified Pseudomonas]AZF49302.1 type III effector HopT1-1 [Pseudomonas sp. R2-7-07]AZF59788.1 type III effector HopT1-1 [Pseudomonas sp. R11-23-07]
MFDMSRFTPQVINPTVSLPLAHQSHTLTENAQVEANLGRFASESTAAHKTIDRLLASLIRLFTLVEGSELKATAKMFSSYSSDVPNFGVIGQLAAGGFNRILDEARQGSPRMHCADEEPLTLREKATAFFNLSNSAYFRETLERIHGSSELKSQVADIIDVPYLESKAFGPARGSTQEHPLPEQLMLYTFSNENTEDASRNPHLYESIKEVNGRTVVSNPAKAGGSLTKVQNDFREAAPLANKVWATAADLKADNRLSSRELDFARLNPRNRVDRDDGQFGYQGPVKSQATLPLAHLVVPRGNGFAVWRVKQDSGFAKDAALQDKPIVAGPSGTTDRFMTAARLLGNGLLNGLGLNQPKAGESSEQTEVRAQREMKELVRWMATGYLVDDNHHSMIEVNLGAANHGLPVQWGPSLYREPFSAPIQTPQFSISSSQVISGLSRRPQVNVHYERYRHDLQGSQRAKVTPDGRVI